MPSLDALQELAAAEVIQLVAVITQPDRLGNRGKLSPPAVKIRALELGLPVMQPTSLRKAALTQLLALRPELLVWAAYGNLVPAVLLDAVGGRAVNVHASLLPRHRGAAPIAHAILAGDSVTGVSLMEGTAALDAGPVLSAERVSIGPSETAGQLTERLAAEGAALLSRELSRYISGEIRPIRQLETAVTWAPKLTTAQAKLDFALPAEELERQVRAFNPEPGAWTSFRGQRLGISRASVVIGAPGAEHGAFVLGDGTPQVAAGAGWLRFDEVEPAGKRAMSGADWARGLRALGDAERVPS